MRKKYNDPIGFKTCNICIKLLPANNDYYSKRSCAKDFLNIICKKCDNNKRTIRFKTKSSHNIHRICKICDKFFYAELCKIKKGWYKFCSIKCRYKALGLHNWNGKRSGSLNPNSRLKENDIYNIRCELKNNISLKDLSNKYKISISHLYSIKYGRSWKHII